MRRLFVWILLCAVLVAALCGTAAVAFAEQNDIKLDLDVTKEGNEVVAVVTVTENDGVVDLYLRVEYDEKALELVDREFGHALSSLGPVDNFEEGGYEYPYRVTYNGSVTNVDDTGRLLTLRFKVKDGAKDGAHSVKLVVRQVGYRMGDLSMEPVYNEKYGEPLLITADPASTKEGGVVAAEKKVVLTDGNVKSITDADVPEETGANALMIGLIVAGAVILIGATLIAYFIYRRKKSLSNK